MRKGERVARVPKVVANLHNVRYENARLKLDRSENSSSSHQIHFVSRVRGNILRGKKMKTDICIPNI